MFGKRGKACPEGRAQRCTAFRGIWIRVGFFIVFCAPHQDLSHFVSPCNFSASRPSPPLFSFIAASAFLAVCGVVFLAWQSRSLHRFMTRNFVHAPVKGAGVADQAKPRTSCSAELSLLVILIGRFLNPLPNSAFVSFRLTGMVRTMFTSAVSHSSLPHLRKSFQDQACRGRGASQSQTARERERSRERERARERGRERERARERGRERERECVCVCVAGVGVACFVVSDCLFERYDFFC